MRTAGVTSRLLGGPCFQSSHSRYRLPCLPWDASSKSIGFPPLEARAAQDRTSLTRKSTRTRRYGKLRSGTTSVLGHRRLRRIALDEFLHPMFIRDFLYISILIFVVKYVTGRKMTILRSLNPFTQSQAGTKTVLRERFRQSILPASTTKNLISSCKPGISTVCFYPAFSF